MKVRDSGMPDEKYWESLFNIELILSGLQIDKNIKNAAEFGSGYGTFSIPIAKRISGSLYAFDIEEEMITRLNLRISEEDIHNIQSVQTDFIQNGTGLEDNSIDYTMLFNILHAEDPLILLNKAYRVLRPGGKTGIIHWIYSETTPRGPSLEIRPKPEHCISWMKTAGFTIVQDSLSFPPYHYGILGIKE